MSQPIPPLVLAFIICDAVHLDQTTGKRTILGTFSDVSPRTLPAAIPSFAVYAAITNGRGTTPLRVALADFSEESEPLLFFDAVANFADPISVLEFHVAFPPVVFPAVGHYRFQLFLGGALCCERRIQVHPVGGSHT